MDETQTKRCSKCETVKPLSEYRRRASVPDGCESACRECRRAAENAKRAARRAAGVCRDCDQPSLRGGRCSTHADADNEHSNARRAALREAAVCFYCGDPAVRGGRCSTHADADNEWLSARRRSEYESGVCTSTGCSNNAVHGQWRCADCADWHRSSAWRHALPALIDADRYTCEYCGREAVEPELEHRIPRKRGGTNDAWNITIACRRCNHPWKADRAYLECISEAWPGVLQAAASLECVTPDGTPLPGTFGDYVGAGL